MRFLVRIAVNCGNPSATIRSLKQRFPTGPSLSGPTTEGAFFIIDCLFGYNWLDINQTKSISCLPTGNWLLNPPCQCK